MQDVRAPRTSFATQKAESESLPLSWWTRKRITFVSVVAVIIVLVIGLIGWWGFVSARHYLEAGNVAFAEKRYTEALKEYGAVEDLGIFHPQAVADALAERGTLFLIKNDTKSAEQDFRKAIQKGKSDKARRQLAALLLQQSKTDEIPALMEKIQEQSVEDEILLARVALRSQNLGEASRRIEEILKKEPTQPEAKKLSSLLLLVSDPKKAENALRSLAGVDTLAQATQKWNDHPRGIVYEAKVAQELLMAGEADIALALTSDILKKETSYRDAEILQGEAYLTIQKYRDAEEVVRATIEDSPLHAPLHYLLARILVGQEKNEEALVAFERAYELGEDGADFHAQYAKLLLAADEKEKALEQQALAYSKEPKNFTYATEFFWQKFDADEDAREMAEKIQKDFPKEDFGFAAGALLAESTVKQEALLAKARSINADSAFSFYVEAMEQESNTKEQQRALLVKAIDIDMSGEISARAERKLKSLR